MTTFIIGNTGYVGSVLVNELLTQYSHENIVGWDSGFFIDSLPKTIPAPEKKITQHLDDIRKYHTVNHLCKSEQKLPQTIVHLAAVSNDPMGREFEEVTHHINVEASLNIAKLAKGYGVKKFVFASSCSLYGAGGNSAKKETDSLNPLTAYAKSKVMMEEGLQKLASPDFQVICLRFATACGASPRIRLDLVLNDFVASAMTSGKIEVLSDGTPWRPLIHVKDMSRAIQWAMEFQSQENFLVVNIGSDEWTYQIKDLAASVVNAFPEHATYSINPDASPDKRSYCVDFSKFQTLAPNHQPQVDLKTAVIELYDHLKTIDFYDTNFRQSHFMRLQHLKLLIAQGKIDESLLWIDPNWRNHLTDFIKNH